MGTQRWSFLCSWSTKRCRGCGVGMPGRGRIHERQGGSGQFVRRGHAMAMHLAARTINVQQPPLARPKARRVAP